MPRLLLSFIVLLSLAAGCGGGETGGDGRPPLVVSAASSLKTAFSDYGESFGEAQARFSFAGSDELAAQIRQGIRPDVFAAANTRLPEDLHEEGLVEAPVAFAANRLVLAVPAGSPIAGLEDLTGASVKLAIGSASVPVGAYTREVLDRLPGGQGRRILARVRSEEPDVAGVVGKLTQGAADAGFVYVTDVEATDGELRSIALPPELQPTVTYGAGVVQGAERPEQAERFVDQLLDGRCADALREAGFRPPPR